MVRFRNMLIHVYDRINDEITFDIYTRRLNDFVLFVSLIRRYLEKTGADRTSLCLVCPTRMPIALLHERELHSFPLALTAAFLYYNPMQLPRRIPSLDEIRTQLMPLFRDAGLQLAFCLVQQRRVRRAPEVMLTSPFCMMTELIRAAYEPDHAIASERCRRRRRSEDRKPAAEICRASGREALVRTLSGIFHSVYSLAFRRYVDTKSSAKR